CRVPSKPLGIRPRTRPFNSVRFPGSCGRVGRDRIFFLCRALLTPHFPPPAPVSELDRSRHRNHTSPRNAPALPKTELPYLPAANMSHSVQECEPAVLEKRRSCRVARLSTESPHYVRRKVRVLPSAAYSALGYPLLASDSAL